MKEIYVLVANHTTGTSKWEKINTDESVTRLLQHAHIQDVSMTDPNAVEEVSEEEVKKPVKKGKE